MTQWEHPPSVIMQFWGHILGKTLHCDRLKWLLAEKRSKKQKENPLVNHLKFHHYVNMLKLRNKNVKLQEFWANDGASADFHWIRKLRRCTIENKSPSLFPIGPEVLIKWCNCLKTLTCIWKEDISHLDFPPIHPISRFDQLVALIDLVHKNNIQRYSLENLWRFVYKIEQIFVIVHKVHQIKMRSNATCIKHLSEKSENDDSHTKSWWQRQ